MMNVFGKILRKLIGNSFTDYEEYYTDNGEHLVSVSDIQEIINQVEQEHNNGWIPCSERLPEVNLFVLVESEHGIWIARLRDYGTHKCFVDRDNDYSCSIDRVIAWQPLPQPYKESDTNGN